MEEDIKDNQVAGATVPADAPAAAQGEQRAPVGTETHELECASRAIDVA